MKPSDFKRWRKDLGLSQKDAAALLGLKRRMVQYYENGLRDGQKVSVPKTVRLACYAVAVGVSDYAGPRRQKSKPKKKPKPKAKTAGKAQAKSKPRTGPTSRQPAPPPGKDRTPPPPRLLRPGIGQPA